MSFEVSAILNHVVLTDEFCKLLMCVCDLIQQVDGAHNNYFWRRRKNISLTYLYLVFGSRLSVL
jgi:hypothetical protein